MATTAGMVEVENKERLSWGWAIAFGLFGVGVLAVVSLIIGSLPERERSVIALGLGMAAIFFSIVGWLEQERSMTKACSLSFLGVSLGGAVFDGAYGARGANWIIGVAGDWFVGALVWLLSFTV